MSVPERMCVGCRSMKPKHELIRIVISPDNGTLVIDEKQKILSRGAYVCKDEKCILTAKKKKAFNRICKKEVPEEIYNELLFGLKSE